MHDAHLIALEDTDSVINSCGAGEGMNDKLHTGIITHILLFNSNTELMLCLQ